jgi:hypothetical protein
MAAVKLVPDVIPEKGTLVAGMVELQVGATPAPADVNICPVVPGRLFGIKAPVRLRFPPRVVRLAPETVNVLSRVVAPCKVIPPVAFPIVTTPVLVEVPMLVAPVPELLILTGDPVRVSALAPVLIEEVLRPDKVKAPLVAVRFKAPPLKVNPLLAVNSPAEVIVPVPVVAILPVVEIVILLAKSPPTTELKVGSPAAFPCRTVVVVPASVPISPPVVLVTTPAVERAESVIEVEAESVVNAPVFGVPDPIVPGAAQVAPRRVVASTVDVQVGATPAPDEIKNCPEVPGKLFGINAPANCIFPLAPVTLKLVPAMLFAPILIAFVIPTAEASIASTMPPTIPPELVIKSAAPTTVEPVPEVSALSK